MTTTTAPRIFPQPAGEYFADHSAWSQSMLKTFLDRRRLAEAYYVLGTTEEPEPSDPMRKGTAVHTALLEPDQFDDLVVCYPDSVLDKKGNCTTNASEDFYQQQTAAGRMVFKAKQLASIRAMAESVRRVCGKWLDMPGLKEQSIYWIDDISGLPCKARLDWLIEREERAFVFDLKSCADASPLAFRRSIETNRLWLQSDHYSSGVEKIVNQRTNFIFVAVESDFPYSTALYELDAESIARGIDARRAALNTLRDCLDSGDFSEPWEKKVNPIPVREWAFSNQF